MSFYIKKTHSWELENPNINHFFHEILFYGINEFLNNDKEVLFVLDTKLANWEHEFTLFLCRSLGINYIYSENVPKYIPGQNGNWDILKHPNFHNVIDTIRSVVVHDSSPKSKVLYFRNTEIRRKMINYNGELDHLFDEIIYDMSKLTFDDQVKLFNRCSHLVTIDGACLANTIFMRHEAKIFCIHPRNIYDCWPIKFGLSRCINPGNFVNYSCGLTDFNSDITFDDDIKNKITEFLS